MPGDLEGLLSLPGIGRYTAGAVASIAFGVEAPVVDGNVMRVLARLTGFNLKITDRASACFFWGLMEEVIAGARESWEKNAKKREKKLKMVVDWKQVGEGRFGDVNQAVMELGATICTPTSPRCGECPVRGFCVASKEGRQGELPVKKKKGAVEVVPGTAIDVVREKQVASSKKQEGETLNEERGTMKWGGEEVLLMQRGVGGVWEGMWEFPVVGEFRVSGFEFRDGGATGAGETKITSCVPVSIRGGVEGNSGGLKLETGNLKQVRRWVEGELGVKVGEVVECGEVVHVLTHRRMELRVVRVEVGTGIKKQGARSKKGEGLPVGVDGVGYVGWRWVGWPLVRGWGVAVGAGGVEGGGGGGRGWEIE